MSVVIDILTVTGSYLAIIVGILFILNFAMNGMVFAYLKVKASRGKYLLVQVRGATGWYYTTGGFEEGRFRYKDRHKKTHSLTNVSDKVVEPFSGLHCVNTN